MLDISRRIEIISQLIAEDTVESATYAALECRLAIEYLCYERLKMELDCVSYADLKGWQPNKVVSAIREMANEYVASSFTLSFAEEPKRPEDQPLTDDERKSLDYRLLGTQSEINLKKIASLWNSLSGTALHVQVPKTKSDGLNLHGELETIKAKVEECLVEFRSIAKGTILMGGWGSEVSIRCVGCNYPVKRKTEFLTEGQVISCVNPDCFESYTVEKIPTGINFNRRALSMDCKKCHSPMNLPQRKAEALRNTEFYELNCPDCGAQHVIKTQWAYALVPERADYGQDTRQNASK